MSTPLFTQTGGIPAHAERTIITGNFVDLSTAASPLCGADVIGGDRKLLKNAASPLLRGGRRFLSKTQPCAGGIPAPAGRTRRLLEVCNEAWRHPRACGADVGPNWPNWFCAGGIPALAGRTD